jgi:5-methylcytosine-specific restriction endonuclease McrA
MSEKVEAKRIKSSALPWFVTSRLSAVEREGKSEVDQACIALEIDGMPCPMDVDPEDWVRENFAYICYRYREAYPRPTYVKPKKKKPTTRPKKAAKVKLKVAGVNVTSDAFLSTYEWRKLRMEALIKYGRKCMCCGATPETGAVMNVDHIKPRKLFPSLALDINNLQILCHPCNHGKGNWDMSDWRKK